MKYIFLCLIFSSLSFSAVYDSNDVSIFPEDVKSLINKTVEEQCAQEGWLYGAFNETIEHEGSFFLTDLSVGEDYDGEAYIIIAKTEDGLAVDYLECPQEDSEY